MPCCKLSKNSGLPCHCLHYPAHISSRCAQGFQRVADNLEDTCLDNPAAREKFPVIVTAARHNGWLDSGFQACGSYSFLLNAFAGAFY